MLLFDHELLPKPDYSGQPFADSFSALLEMLEASMLSYDDPQENVQRSAFIAQPMTFSLSA